MTIPVCDACALGTDPDELCPSCKEIRYTQTGWDEQQRLMDQAKTAVSDSSRDALVRYLAGKTVAIDRAVHNSPPPLDDVGGCDPLDFDVMDPNRPVPNRQLSPNPKQAYGDKKVPLGLVPSTGVIYAARAFAEGARKYGAFNWRKSAVESMTYVAAAQRHLLAWVDGQDDDLDTGHPHLAHAIACLMILADAHECGNLLDTRPPYGPASDLLEQWQDV